MGSIIASLKYAFGRLGEKIMRNVSANYWRYFNFTFYGFAAGK